MGRSYVRLWALSLLGYRRLLHGIWLFRPFAVSPPPLDDSPLALSPPGSFASWLVRPRTWYHCDTTTETPQPSMYGGEQARGQIV